MMSGASSMTSSASWSEPRVAIFCLCPGPLIRDRVHFVRWCSAVPPRERADHRNTIHIEPYPVTFSPGQALDFYGTRLSTVILVRRDGQVLFVEREPWILSESGELQKQDPAEEHVFRVHISLQDKN
jgi:hypothetical protein